MKRALLCCALLLTCVTIFRAQSRYMDNQTNYQYNITKTQELIILDGIPNESAWMNVDSITNFWQLRPVLKENADGKTVIKMTYTDDFLYVSGVFIEKDKNVVHTLKRDLEIFTSDGFGVILDPANQKTNGVMFGVNAFGAQNESLIAGDEFNSDWNNKWFAETYRGNGMWSVEMAIPFKSLRYKKGDTKWGLNFVRNVVNQNEIHIWTPIPDQFLGYDLGYLGLLEWDSSPPSSIEM